MNDDTMLKTGTTTVGLVCKDCVVLGADMRMSAGHMIVDNDADKVIPINKRMAVTLAGNVSDLQRLIKYIRANIRVKELHTGSFAMTKEVANLLGSYIFGNVRSTGAITQFLLAGYDNNEGATMYDLFPDGTITKIKKFFTSGSGSTFAMGVIEADFKENLSEKEGVDLAIRAMSVALKRDSGSGDGINVYVISQQGVKKVFSQKVANTI